MFTRALELDAGYAQASAGMALSYNRDLLMGYADHRDAVTNKALEAARQAVSFDQSDSLAHSVMGMALLWAGQNEEAILTTGRRL